MQLREKKVFEYTVKELPMRETMRVLGQYPKGGDERGAAILGASVFNGAAEPLGLKVLDLGTGLYRALMEAHEEVNGRLVDPNAPKAPEGDEGNG